MSDIDNSPSIFDRISSYINRDVVKLAVGIGAAALIGYAIYYDYNRPQTIEFKPMISESRIFNFILADDNFLFQNRKKNRRLASKT